MQKEVSRTTLYTALHVFLLNPIDQKSGRPVPTRLIRLQLDGDDNSIVTYPVSEVKLADVEAIRETVRREMKLAQDIRRRCKRPKVSIAALVDTEIDETSLFLYAATNGWPVDAPSAILAISTWFEQSGHVLPRIALQSLRCFGCVGNNCHLEDDF